MTHSDQEIREALLSEDEGALRDLGEEPSVFEMIFGIFQGRNRWLNIFGWFLAVVIFGLSIYAMVQFVQAEALEGLIFWGLWFALGIIMTMALKIWFWMEMNKNAVVREILRLELRLVELEKRLRR